jgi:hypothetical protein
LFILIKEKNIGVKGVNKSCMLFEAATLKGV